MMSFTPFAIGRFPTVASIQGAVCSYYGVEMREMLSERRQIDVARARQVAMFLARALTPKSLPHIGHLFRRDHSTVLHATRRIAALAANDAGFAKDIAALRAELAG